MNMEIRSFGDITVLALFGRFDKNTAPSVATWLTEATSTPPANLVVNLAEVNFVDSTALATLVQALKRCQQQQGNLHLCSLQRQVLMIFELTRLDKAFNIFVDENHAIQSFAV